MLIRSQDEKSLYNINTNKGIYIATRAKGVEIVAEGFGDMGSYSSVSKAIKVLDMIQERHLDIEKARLEMKMFGWVSTTFQMPQDYEVGNEDE